MISWHDLRREPFRLLFPLGMLCGLFGVGHWLGYATGWQATASGQAHATIQIGGFLLCFIAGFLMTALPRFTAGATATTPEVLAFMAGVMGTVAASSLRQWRLAEGLFGLLLVMLARFAWRRASSRRGGLMPPTEFLWIGMGLLHGLLGVACLLAGRADGAPSWLLAMGRPLMLQGAVLGIVMGVAGFMAPRLMGHPVWLAGPDVSPARLRRRRLQWHGVGALLFLASFVAEGVGALRMAYLLRAAVATAILGVSTRWYRRPRAREGYVLLLWASLWLILLGLWAAGVWPRYRVTMLHIVFIGGFSLMIFGVATMVVLSHAGEAPRLQRGLWVLPIAGLGLGGAFASRVAADLHPSAYLLLLGLAAACWMIPAIAWLGFSAPRLLRPISPGQFERAHDEAKRRLQPTAQFPAR